MILRLLLVSAVASLGLEMPSARDIASWHQTGRAWIDARLAELEASIPTETEAAPTDVVAAELPEAIEAPVAPVDLAEAVPAPVAPEVKSDEDRAFAAIVDGMATTFAADLAPVAVRPEAPLLAAEPSDVPEFVNPGVAFANELNRLSEGIAPAPALSAPIAEESAPESRGERLVHAVRLTGQALNAWATFLQGPNVVSLHP